MKLLFGLAILSVGAAATFACGSSDKGTGGSASVSSSAGPTGPGPGSGGMGTGGMGTGGMGTGGMGTGGMGSGGAGGGAMTCQEKCIADNMAAAAVFEQYELQACGCAAMGNPPC